MLVKSARFGNIEVKDECIFSLPHGLPGFGNETKFALLAPDENSPFCFFQSINNEDLTFVLINPFDFFPDYEFKLTDEILEELKISNDNPPLVFNIVTIPKKIEEMTANLVAPLILNKKDGIAMQIVLEKTQYTTKHRVLGGR